MIISFLCRRKIGKLKGGNLVVVPQQDRVKNCKEVTCSKYCHSDAAAKMPSSKVKNIFKFGFCSFMCMMPFLVTVFDKSSQAELDCLSLNRVLTTGGWLGIMLSL